MERTVSQLVRQKIFCKMVISEETIIQATYTIVSIFLLLYALDYSRTVQEKRLLEYPFHKIKKCKNISCLLK